MDALCGSHPGAGRIAVLSVGCKANREEMECLLSRLSAEGFSAVPFGEPAEWVVVNTCTVTASGDSDSRQMIRRAVRAKGAGRVVVTGCLAQRDPSRLAALEGVDWLVGNGEKGQIAEWILRARGSGAPAGREAARPELLQVSGDPTLTAFPGFREGRTGRRTRATLKVQDGCDEHCTYCVIPSVRGRSRSRTLEDALRQAEILVRSGYREIALTGINTALWGRDLPGKESLPDLVDALARVPGLERIRLNSLEPQYVTPDWCERMAGQEKLCRHFHLPLQSGDPVVLRRMGRAVSPQSYAARIAALRRCMPEAAIGCDVLVGFPGETDQQFENTLRFLCELSPAYLHVFSFSPRPGTAAPRLGGEIAPEVRRERSRRLLSLDRSLRRRFSARAIGTVESVIPERRDRQGGWRGLTGTYLRVHFPWTAGSGPSGSVLVLLEEIDPDGRLRGRALAAGAGR